jgi:hypothetical protein
VHTRLGPVSGQDGRGGEFYAHQDHQALTVLVPLSEPHSFEGGGTGFWAAAPDAASREAADRHAPPTLVLKPPAGDALLFAGSVTHAGMPVRAGERVVLVASFSRRRTT